MGAWFLIVSPSASYGLVVVSALARFEVVGAMERFGFKGIRVRPDKNAWRRSRVSNFTELEMKFGGLRPSVS